MEHGKNKLNDIILHIISDYIKTRCLRGIKISVIITADIFDTYIKLSHESQHDEIQGKKNWVSTLNGTIVLPENIDGSYNLLLNEEYVVESINHNNCNWIGTLCHEMTHIYDNIDFMNLSNITEYIEMPHQPNYDMFNHWSEFNARRIGYYFLRKYLLDNPADESLISHIFNAELPFQINNYFNNYHTSQDGNVQVYYTMQFLGRLKTWKELYPNQFTKNMLQKMFDSNPWLLDLFIFLDENDTIQKVYPKLLQLRETLKNNFVFTDNIGI